MFFKSRVPSQPAITLRKFLLDAAAGALHFGFMLVCHVAIQVALVDGAGEGA